MDATDLAVQFIMQGYAVVPDVIVGDELEAIRDAFERLASRLGKRAFTPAEIETAPELVNFIGHPRVMPVIEAYMGHFGHEPAIAWLQLCRDIFNPELPPPPPFDIATDGKTLGLHNDASNAMANRLSFHTLSLGAVAFVFMDDTYPDAGCLLQSPGSHHLTQASPDGCVISPSKQFIKQHCSVEFVAAKAGDVVLQRAFNFHGVGPPPRQKRRQLRTDYTPMALYDKIALDGRTGMHQQFARETIDLLPSERHRYFCGSALRTAT